MPKIPEYPSKTQLTENDILVTDGPEGTKHARIGDVVDDLAALMGDDTMSQEGKLAPAGKVGEAIEVLTQAETENAGDVSVLKNAAFGARRYANNETGLYTINIGGININGGNNASTNRARTTYIDFSGPRKLVMADDVYNIFRVYIYANESPSSMTRCVVSKSQKGTKSVIITPENAETRVRVVFTLAEDENHDMTENDLTAISERLQVFSVADTTFTQENVPADSYTLGIKGVISRGTLTSENDLDDVLQRGVYYWTSSNPPAHAPFDTDCRMIELGTDRGTQSHAITQIIWNAKNEMCYRTTNTASRWNDFVFVSNGGDIATLQAAMENMINDRTVYTFGQDDILWNFGGVALNGKTNSYTTRIRIMDANGLAAIPVRAGTSITANDGYKFNIAEYSYFRSNSDFELIGYRTMLSEPYTVDKDCYIRVSVGSLNDAELWEEDAEGLKSFTAAGEAAKNGIVLNIIDGTVKERIANIEMTQESVRKLGEIPINAVSYHALWDDMVANGEVERELISRIGNDANLPVYLYKIRNDMDHIAPDYSIITWDGENEIYARPKVFLTGSIHGNERTPAYAIYDMVNSMLHDTQYRFMLNAFEWYIVPLVNPWGFSHSARLRSTGAIDKGNNYSSSTISNYNILDNSEAIHQGIRRNSAGIDANRDFANFATQEAQNIRTAVNSILSPGEKFAFAIDAHQAQNGSYINVIGAFLSLHYGASEEEKKLIFSKWMEAGSVTEKLMADYVDTEKHQSIYPWDGTDLMTMRNYMAAYADYAMCFEGGQTCVYYSGSTEWSNPIARALFNTQYHEFLKLLSEKLS